MMQLYQFLLLSLPHRSMKLIPLSLLRHSLRSRQLVDQFLLLLESLLEIGEAVSPNKPLTSLEAIGYQRLLHRLSLRSRKLLDLSFLLSIFLRSRQLVDQSLLLSLSHRSF